MKDIWDKIWKEDSSYSSSEYRKMTDYKIKRITFDSSIKDSTILEIGCGDGIVLKKFLEMDENNTLIGLDISEYAISQAKEENTKIRFDVCDARNLTIESDSMDLVYSIGLIEHFNHKDLTMCLNEKKRVLKTNGQLVIMIPNKLSFGRVQRKIMNILGKWSFGYQTEFTPNEMMNILKEAGFRSIEVKTYNVFKPKKLDSFYFIWLIDTICHFFKKDNYFHLYIRGVK